MNHRPRELELGAIFPERRRAADVEAKALGDLREKVITLRIAEVTRADLRGHVPAIKGRRRVFNAADVEEHVGDGRKGVPFQTQVDEERIIRVGYLHLA